MNMHMTWPGEALEFFAAAEDAIRQVPPAFPLEATVAVNPWLGQTGEDRAVAAARLARVGGGAMFLPRQSVSGMIDSGEITPEDLADAAARHGITSDALRRAARLNAPSVQPLPTVADLAREASGIDWPGLIEERFGSWAAAHFDQGQAFWPAAKGDAWRSWRAYGSRDLTPGLAGLHGFNARVAEAPTDVRAAFCAACDALGLTREAAQLYFHRLLVTLSGWAQYARHLGWIAERDGGRDRTLFELLTIRLIWDEALLEQGGALTRDAWHAALHDYAMPIEPDQEMRLCAALQEAADLGAERKLADMLDGPSAAVTDARPAIQAAFCIDVRSEVLRRALEAADPDLRTIGFAGFFGLPIRHHGHASDIVEMRAPILLAPAVDTQAEGDDTESRIYLRAIRAWGRFKRAAVSAFAFVEAAGPLYVGKLVRDGLGLPKPASSSHAPTLHLPLEERVAAAARILKAMSLTSGFARLVLICGHGSEVANAPHRSALQCGACGGHAGDVNARLLAALLNDQAVRGRLAGEGIEIPADTHFVAGLHDTVSDEVALFTDGVHSSHAGDIARLKLALKQAGALARTERAQSLPHGVADALASRGQDWSEIRPEWGLAGCRGFIAAPRSRTAGRDLGGRVFLHDYDWRQDEDAATLELILSAPVVVASWIALQYHGSTVAPETFGAGNKLLHNVVGGIGVLEGNGGALRAGLPWQSVHDGAAPRHAASRLVVAIDAPEAMISEVLDRQPHVRALFDNGWLTLVRLDETGAVAARYTKNGWAGYAAERAEARSAA
ncbi:YbcC family protein [Roseivivax sp. THAF30]|uniref:YbcC family protein n=1 Tax=Roseivivax sp. THAF30 TaxID=2587852 RepID=UPI001267CF90|nr:DUF2309 domain-containing protein [Roseivivax sp. THAF30]QFT64337.1 hypothetical protein FIU91_15470 [Roseivivax sp. THAF30]